VDLEHQTPGGGGSSSIFDEDGDTAFSGCRFGHDRTAENGEDEEDCSGHSQHDAVVARAATYGNGCKAVSVKADHDAVSGPESAGWPMKPCERGKHSPAQPDRGDPQLPRRRRRALRRLHDLEEARRQVASGRGTGFADRRVPSDRPVREIAAEILGWLGWLG
jgi:hypothetical protein